VIVPFFPHGFGHIQTHKQISVPTQNRDSLIEIASPNLQEDQTGGPTPVQTSLLAATGIVGSTLNVGLEDVQPKRIDLREMLKTEGDPPNEGRLSFTDA
jgi:hypothetical protein